MRRDFRDRISEFLDEVPDAQIREWIEQSLHAEKDGWVTCTECKHRIPVRIADVGQRAKLLDILASHAKGKPAPTARQESETAAKPVEVLTLVELEAEEARLLNEYPDLAGAPVDVKPQRRRKAAAR